ncbi:glycosyltransferase family 2 protein [Colwellia sp. 1_MG-2023]|uniref:glycosyltransferase family 2 protein n=1 Tax=Colwellia sp. 1_MG-2023 TaxID=3062649 RepID=UPI0026E41C29|nr:glycosyltransferase family 2 protein [Colwellia sp. 1_MG-2023]MDO6444982.1 glycosyltransferase family 2 protein [Colwellia sp. 1_MG-2023]
MDHQTQENIYLSIVIPLYNEEDNVDVLIDTIIQNVLPLKVSYEIILVDDGSSDNTWNKIRQYSAPVKGVKLARNFGHQHALLAGLSESKGDAIISMDGDMQHPPSLIEKLVEKHKEGYLVVNTYRNDAHVASYFKRKTSSMFYKCFSFLTDVSMAPGTSDFRLLDKIVLKELLKLKAQDLFLRGAVEWLGFESVTIPYVAGERFSGVSKYPLSKMLNFAKGSIISFSTKPLAIGVWLGVFTSALAFLEIIYIIYQVLIGETVAGWASTVGIISFLFGVLFIMLGIIGSYLARIHVALQNRPRFIVEEITEKKDV